jgi:hypothetical protein
MSFYQGSVFRRIGVERFSGLHKEMNIRVTGDIHEIGSIVIPRSMNVGMAWHLGCLHSLFYSRRLAIDCCPPRSLLLLTVLVLDNTLSCIFVEL